VVDDVDSLELDQQSDVFQMMNLVISRTMAQKHPSSRAILTARLELGAAPTQLVNVKGLEEKEFFEYVEVTAKSIGIPASYSKSQMQKFYKASSGSPAFASSILRLMQTGQSFALAIEQWKGSDGETVRRFAFKRELDKLTGSQIRTLYAMCILGTTSQLELSQILGSTEMRLRDDLSELRKYHLYAFTGAVHTGGAHLEVPNPIRLMQEVIRERISDPTRIDKECATARKNTTNVGIDNGPIINRVVALWRDEQFTEALAAAQYANTKSPEDPALLCLLGRAYLKMVPSNAAQADIAFKKASKLGCDRPELFSLWIDARSQLQDWIGVIDVTKLADKDLTTAENAIIRAKAYISLAHAAEQSGLLDKAAKSYFEGGKDVDIAIRARKYHLTTFVELKELRADLMFNYVRVTDRQHTTPRSHIYVWLAAREAFNCFVRRPLLVRTGVARLTSWWDSVCRNEKSDLKAAELMKVQLGNLDAVIQALEEQQSPDETLLAEVKNSKAMLASSWSDFRRQLQNKDA